MNFRLLVVPVLISLFLLLGCAQEPETPATSTPVEVVQEPTSTATTEPVTNTPAPTASARPTITPEPTPVLAALKVETQTLTDDGTLIVESVNSGEPGWVVVYADNAGLPGAVLGFEAVTQETIGPVSVTIDPWAATPTLHAKLHVDAGDSGDFEFPGSDAPVLVGSEEVAETFTIDIQLPVPAIDVADQIVSEDGLVSVGGVLALTPNWLVIHADEDGAIGQVIGQVPVEEGQNYDLVFPIRWRGATTELTAVLYEDKERPGGFDPTVDLPVLAGGAAVVVKFNVQLPPDIFAFDQPVVDGKLSLERIVSEKPAWIVVYNDSEGQPDSIIGFEKVDEGVNQRLTVEVVEGAITPQLFLALHEESENPAEFNFPAGDYPATYNGQIIPPTILLTNPGNYLVTRDQALGEKNEIIVPLAVTDLDAWLVIYTESDNGQPEEIIGQLWLPAGVNRDNLVPVPAASLGKNLLAALHQDAGTPRQFDYPDGDDIPLQRNRQIIISPFLLKENAEAESFSP